MGFFKKDLEKGKKIFFKYNGSAFAIARDLGDEYSKCNIPKKLEEEWLKEIETKLITQIKKINAETTASQVCSLFCDIANFSGLSYENRANHFISYLGDNYTKLDTFTVIRFCEELKLIKRYSRYAKVQNTTLGSKIDEVVKFYANKLLSEPITIDDSHKDSYCIKNHVFSDENIKKRIQDLLK